MRKVISILVLSLFLFGFTIPNSPEPVENDNPCLIEVQFWYGTIFNRQVRFSSYACAQNAGATNIFYGGYWSHCEVFTCI